MLLATSCRVDSPALRAQADRHYRAGIAQLEARYPNGHPDLAAAWFMLGASIDAGRTAEGRPFLQKALAWREAHYGKNDRRTIETRGVLGRVSP